MWQSPQLYGRLSGYFKEGECYYVKTYPCC